MSTLRFATRDQAILFECELKGQMSDGFWENSRPYDHWEAPCKAKVEVAETPEQVGKDGVWISRNYDFANKELFDIVGDRMINYVKIGRMLPTVPIAEIESITSSCINVEDGTLSPLLSASPTAARKELKALKVLKDMTEQSIRDEETRKKVLRPLNSEIASINYRLSQRTKLVKMLTDNGMTLLDLTQCIEMVDEIEYTEKQCRKDLRACAEVVRKR